MDCDRFCVMYVCVFVWYTTSSVWWCCLYFILTVGILSHQVPCFPKPSSTDGPCMCVCVLQARREYLQKKEEAAEGKKKFSETVYGERLSDSDQSFFGGGSSEEPSGDDLQKKAQPFTGGWAKRGKVLK